VFRVRRYPFRVENAFYQGSTDIVPFESEELFGTKLRALLQRRRIRDLLDLNEGLSPRAISSSEATIVATFGRAVLMRVVLRERLGHQLLFPFWMRNRSASERQEPTAWRVFDMMALASLAVNPKDRCASSAMATSQVDSTSLIARASSFRSTAGLMSNAGESVIPSGSRRNP